MEYEQVMFYVYKITNLINGKLYIGKTDNLAERWQSHLWHADTGGGYALHRSIRKYGKDNFKISIIEEFDTEKEALNREVYWIAEYKTNILKHGRVAGYNMTDGGDGTSGPKNEEWIAKIAASNRGKIRSPGTRAKVSAAQLGKKALQKTKNKMSLVHTGKHMGEANNQAKLTEV